MRAKLVGILLSGGVLCGLGGSCLPPNFFADLAGSVVSTTVNTVVTELLSALLDAASAG